MTFLIIPNISNLPSFPLGVMFLVTPNIYNFPLGVTFLIIPNIPNCLTFPLELIFLMSLILGIWHLLRSGPEGAGVGRWQMWLGSAGRTVWDYF